MHPPIISIISQYTTAYNIKIEKFDKKISRKGLKERILKFFYLEEVFKTRLTEKLLAVMRDYLLDCEP